MAQTDLRADFLHSKCPEKENVQEWLNGLCVKKEVLAKAGVTVSEEDFRSTIISSLPQSLSNFASSLLASARIFSSTKTVEPVMLISLIVEEWERGHTRKLRTAPPAASKPNDEAYSVTVPTPKGRTLQPG